MASIAKDPQGKLRILFVAPDGKRKTIRLGKVARRAAEQFKLRVERLLESRLMGHAIDADTAKWVAELASDTRDKLVRVDLIDPTESCQTTTTLGQHLDHYFDKRSDVKSATATNWAHTRRNLLKFFGPNKQLRSITVGDARDFERWLATPEARENKYAESEASDGLSRNTIRKRISNAKQFFEDAIERGILEKNPFASLKGAVGSNRDRDYFLTRQDTEKLLEACPDAQWRLILALSRYGGLRCPSEHLALTWDDIDWNGRITIHSSKTEHHEGGGVRVIPLFPELRPHLEAVFEEAEPGTPHVITRYRDPNKNLRTQFQRIIKRAGLTPWPKLFQNLRASRATELAAEHPAHVAAAWLGHSTLVANKHYWQVTDDDFERAAQPAGESAAQNAAQQVHATRRKESQTENRETQKPLVLQDNASSCESMREERMGDTGFEQPRSSPEKSEFYELRGAECGAVDFLPSECDPELQQLLEIWPQLSTSWRQQILSIAHQLLRLSTQS